MSNNRQVPDSWDDSVFDSSRESRHLEGGRPSGTSTPNQSDGEGEGLSQTQQLLRTNQQPCTAHKKQHAPLTTVHSTQPPSLQQLFTQSEHRSCRHHRYTRTQIEHEVGREGIGKQLNVNKHAHMAGRQTGKHTLAALHNIPTLQPTVIHNTRSHHKSTQRIAVITVGCVRVGWGWSAAPSAAELLEFPVILAGGQGGGGRNHPVPEPRSMV